MSRADARRCAITRRRRGARVDASRARVAMSRARVEPSTRAPPSRARDAPTRDAVTRRPRRTVSMRVERRVVARAHGRRAPDDVDAFDAMFRDLERETRSMFERAARETRALEGRRRDALDRRRSATRDAGVGDDWRREERGEKLLPGGGVHRYYVSERVTTYGGAPARGARDGAAVGSSASLLATCLALGVAATYARLGRKFFKGFDRTSYKEDAKFGLTARWPLLYASSRRFRDEFAAATADPPRVDRGAAPVVDVDADADVDVDA
jgi:hypothetical protein